MNKIENEVSENIETEDKKIYEILEWVKREVVKWEWKLVMENPDNFSDAVQRKYFWVAKKDYKRVSYFEWDIPDWFILVDSTLYDPYAKEYYTVKDIKPVEVQSIENRITELKQKVVNKTITKAEKEELTLLTL